MLARSHNALIRVFSSLATLFFACVTCTTFAQPSSFIGVLQERTATGTAAQPTDNKRTVLYYDAANIAAGPLFSVFLPYENGTGNLYEDPSSVTVNPSTGDIYIFAFDSAPTADQWSIDPGNDPGTADDDTNGDWDLYRINFSTVFNNWKTNYMGQQVRTIVGPNAVGGPAPTYRAGNTAGGLDDYVTYGVTSQFATAATTNANHQSTDGVFDAVANGAHSNTKILPGAIEKIGEVNRNRYTGTSNFHTPLVSFISQSELFLVDDARENKADPSVVGNDYDYRIVQRVSASPNLAVEPGTPTGVDGGFNRGTTESWESRRIAQMNLDADQAVSVLSDPQSSAYYNFGTGRGAWVVDRDRNTTKGNAYPVADDNNGDDIAFLQLDANGNSLGYRPFAASANPVGGAGGTKFEMDNDPVLNDNVGHVGHVFVDPKNGDLIVVTEGYLEPTPAEPSVYRVPVNYNSAGQISLGTWGPKMTLVPGPKNTGDSLKEVGYWSTFDSNTNKVYFIGSGESDTDAAKNFSNDIYVLDLATGLTTPYMDVGNNFQLFPNTGGTNTNMEAADKLFSFSFAPPGDFNGDFKVNAADYTSWRKNDNTTNGYAAFRENFQQNAAGGAGLDGAAAVPEPASVALFMLGLVAFCARRRGR